MKINPKDFVVHWKKKTCDVYVGRPTIWGNPFSHKEGTLAKFKVTDRDTAVEKYREWILDQPELLKRLPELKGKVLGCWCSPLRCHAEILAELANQESD